MAHTKGVVSRGLHKDKLIQTNADNPLLTVTICGVFGNDETANADANLIVDAFNVTNETGLTPRELLAQRDELVELIHDAGSQIEYLHDKFSETGTGNNVISRIKSLLTKINTKP